MRFDVGRKILWRNDYAVQDYSIQYEKYATAPAEGSCVTDCLLNHNVMLSWNYFFVTLFFLFPVFFQI